MKPRVRGATFFSIACVLALILAAPHRAAAQGCALCRDTTAGSAPKARKALRLAIPLLGIPALCIFAGAFVIAKRIKPGGPSEP